MTVMRIDAAELKAIIDHTFDRLHNIIREATSMGWRVTRVYSPGKLTLTISLDNLPRYAALDVEMPPLHQRINRHIERLTVETQTRVLSYEVDIEQGTLGLYIQVNANLVSAAIDQAQAYDKRWLEREAQEEQPDE